MAYVTSEARRELLETIAEAIDELSAGARGARRGLRAARRAERRPARGAALPPGPGGLRPRPAHPRRLRRAPRAGGQELRAGRRPGFPSQGVKGFLERADEASARRTRSSPTCRTRCGRSRSATPSCAPGSPRCASWSAACARRDASSCARSAAEARPRRRRSAAPRSSLWSTTSTPSFSALAVLAAPTPAPQISMSVLAETEEAVVAPALSQSRWKDGAGDLLAAARIGDRAGDHDGLAGQRCAGDDRGGRSSSRTSRSTPSSRRRASSARVLSRAEVRVQAGGDLRADVLDLLQRLLAGVGDLLQGRGSRRGRGAWRSPRRPSGSRGRSARGAGRPRGCGRSTRASGRPRRRRCRRSPAGSSRSSA